MDRQHATFEQPGNRRHVDGGDKALVARNGPGFGRAKVKRADIEVVVLGFVGDQRQRRGFKGHQADDFDLLETAGLFGQLPHQVLRLAAGGADENPLRRFYLTERLGGRASVLDVFIRPVGIQGHSRLLCPYVSRVSKWERKLPAVRVSFNFLRIL